MCSQLIEGFIKIMFVLTLILFPLVVANENLIIQLNDGPIQGFHKTSYNGRQFSSFEGIPYAAPPIKNYRFQDPQPVSKWTEILSANQLYTCIQLADDQVLGTEDCLYINVYVPRIDINPDDNLDVVVHIHGGAFMAESPQAAGPSKIMDRDVIYVNFNYRLGPFGFLTTPDNVFRGNYGMKDQLEALRWVQKNIKFFGGNKESVTLIGLSAGGASVHLHYFNSNKNEILFHKGWAQSGSVLNPWVVHLNSFRNSEKFIKSLGCLDEGMNVNSSCLMDMDSFVMTQGILSVYEGPLLPLAPFAPTIDDDFLINHPLESLKVGEVFDKPFIISQATAEGWLPAFLYYENIDYLNNNWQNLSPLMLEFYHLSNEEQHEIANKIKDFYFNGEDLSANNFDRFITVCTERLFHLGAEKSVKMQANISTSETYFLMFGYNNGNTGFDGVGHAGDAKYLYDVYEDIYLTEEEEKVKEVMLDFLVSFAKSGKPTSGAVVKWNKIPQNGNLEYLLLKNHDNLEMISVNQLGEHKFWESMGLN